MSARWYSQDACSSTTPWRSALLPLWHLLFQLGPLLMRPNPLYLNLCIEKKNIKKRKIKDTQTGTPLGVLAKCFEEQPGDTASRYCAFKSVQISPAETLFKWHIFYKMTLTFAPIGVNTAHKLPVDFPFGFSVFFSGGGSSCPAFPSRSVMLCVAGGV